MMLQRKFVLAASLLVLLAQLPANAHVCNVHSSYNSNSSILRPSENCLVFANDEIISQSNVLLSFDVAEVRKNIISQFWAPMRDTLVGYRDTIGFIRLISYDAQEMKISITNASESDVAKKALELYLKEANLSLQSFNIRSDAGILTITPSEDWLSGRTEVLLNQSISIMQERFDEIDVAVRISRTGLNGLIASTENFALTERGNQFLVNSGSFSINEIIFIASAPPENLPPSSRVVSSEDGKKYYVISSTPLVSNSKLIAASPSLTGNNFPALIIDFNDSDGSFFEHTSANVGRPLAFVFDGVVVSTPYIRAPIDNGDLEITGLPSLEVASTYSILMNLQVLPIKFSIVGEGVSDKL
jgi:preprotein translocase subunit SecD